MLFYIHELIVQTIAIILNRMKKRQTSSKSLKPKPSSFTPKKQASKSKSQPKQPRKEEEYLILGDEFYIARTQTERQLYQEFQKQVKSRPVPLKKVAKKSSRELQPINLQEYVKSLSKAEKEQLFHDLEKEIEIEKQEPPSLVENETEEKLSKLNVKLETIRGELMKRWEEEINKINHLFENEQISLEDKNQKIRLVEKIRNNKLAMIDHIRLLFNKIMLEDGEPDLNKPEQIENIINSLGSLNSFYSLCQNSEVPISSAHSPFESEIPPISQEAQSEKKSQPQEEIEEYESIKREFFHEESPNQQPQTIEPLQIQPFSRQNLKLDIRLDEVQFGKDHYDEQPAHKDLQPQSEQHSHKEAQLTKPQNPSPPAQNLAIHLNNDKKQLQDQFLCKQDDSRLKIPLLMTKDRLQQIQLQKTGKEKQMLAIGIKSRMSYQVGQIIPQTKGHFTTLIDINAFIESFYEFIMQRFLKEVIEGLNLAYGKSSLDKLFQLNKEGIVQDTENNVLLQQMLEMFHREITLNVRKVSQYERYHNRAIFTAFNAALNVYRPYYDLQGDVFPWNTSEKGLTFYEISEDNIEQVFEKSKMKVLEYCTNLCGIMPNVELTTAEAQKQLEKRNKDCYELVLKTEIKQKFGDWYIKVLNFEALERLYLCKEIIEDQLNLFCQELLQLLK